MAALNECRKLSSVGKIEGGRRLKLTRGGGIGLVVEGKRN